MDLRKIRELLRDYSPVSSPEQIQGFIESSVHQDFINELIVRIERMREAYDDGAVNKYHETRGGIAALEQTVDIFVHMRDNKMEDLTRKPLNEDAKDEEIL
jgi:hypothetical protein